MKMSEFKTGEFVALEDYSDQQYLCLYLEKDTITVLAEDGGVFEASLEKARYREKWRFDPVEFPGEFPRKSLMPHDPTLSVEEMFGSHERWQGLECCMARSCSARMKNPLEGLFSGHEDSTCADCIFHPDYLSQFKDLEEEARKV